MVARNLEKRLSAAEVSFLFVDMIGRQAIRLPRADRAGNGRGEAERMELEGSLYDRVLRTQRLYQEDDGEGGYRLLRR